MDIMDMFTAFWFFQWICLESKKTIILLSYSFISQTLIFLGSLFYIELWSQKIFFNFKQTLFIISQNAVFKSNTLIENNSKQYFHKKINKSSWN